MLPAADTDGACWVWILQAFFCVLMSTQRHEMLHLTEFLDLVFFFFFKQPVRETVALWD